MGSWVERTGHVSDLRDAGVRRRSGRTERMGQGTGQGGKGVGRQTGRAALATRASVVYHARIATDSRQTW